jgi:hypothetical protein
VAIIYLVSCGNNLLNNFELWQLFIWLAVAINYLLNCGKYLSGELWQLFGGMGNKLSGEMWQ